MTQAQSQCHPAFDGSNQVVSTFFNCISNRYHTLETRNCCHVGAVLQRLIFGISQGCLDVLCEHAVLYVHGEDLTLFWKMTGNMRSSHSQKARLQFPAMSALSVFSGQFISHRQWRLDGWRARGRSEQVVCRTQARLLLIS